MEKSSEKFDWKSKLVTVNYHLLLILVILQLQLPLSLSLSHISAMATFGVAEKKITAKLEKLRKENPEEVEEILKTVIPPSNRNPPNRSQWRKVELAMKFINKSKAEAEKQKASGSRTGSPSKSSRPATPDTRKSITSIESREHDKLLARSATRQQLIAKSPNCPTVVIGHKEKPEKVEKQLTTEKSSTASTESTETPPCSSSSSTKPAVRPVQTSSATTNTDTLSDALERKISLSKSTTETATETEHGAKVLLSKKVQTEISLMDDHEIAETSSPKGKKKPLKKQKSLSKIMTNML